MRTQGAMHVKQPVATNSQAWHAPPRRRTRQSQSRLQATLEEQQQASARLGTCHLVGAGPGDPELVTVKAVKLLQQADAVVYDDLGTEGLLDLAPASAERLYVGKRGGKAESAAQGDIDSLLVGLCKQGKTVVRLKGGCPSVFSRVHSELSALRREGIPYTLVPGVSSVLAAPLMAGFPLTDVAVGNSFAVITGHSPDAVDWASFNGVPTLVILMGGAALARIVAHLSLQARDPTTPVCIIHSAATPSQRVWRGTLSTIVAVTEGQKLSPCIIVVSPVAG